MNLTIFVYVKGEKPGRAPGVYAVKVMFKEKSVCKRMDIMVDDTAGCQEKNVGGEDGSKDINKDKRSNNRSLMDTGGNWTAFGSGIIDVGTLDMIRKKGCDPGRSSEES